MARTPAYLESTLLFLGLRHVDAVGHIAELNLGF